MLTSLDKGLTNPKNALLVADLSERRNAGLVTVLMVVDPLYGPMEFFILSYRVILPNSESLLPISVKMLLWQSRCPQ